MTLFDNKKIRKWLVVFSKFEAMADDADNDNQDFWVELDTSFIQFGGTYRVTFEDLGGEPKAPMSITLKLFDDAKTRSMFKHNAKLGVMIEDERNPGDEFWSDVEHDFLKIGGTYRLTIEELKDELVKKLEDE